MQTHNSLEKGKKIVINPCKKRATQLVDAFKQNSYTLVGSRAGALCLRVTSF